MKRFQRFGFIIMGSFVLIIAVFVLAIGISGPRTAVAHSYPPTTAPAEGMGGVDPGPDSPSSQEMQTLGGHGFDQAPAALQASLTKLPFHARLADYLPQGMSIYNAESQLIGTDNQYGNFDLYYMTMSKGTISEQALHALHIYQTNQTIDKNASPDAQRHWSDVKTITINSNLWTYRLLSYPQPDGTALKLHEIDWTFDDGVFVELDIRIGDASEAMMDELTKVASSLH